MPPGVTLDRAYPDLFDSTDCQCLAALHKAPVSVDARHRLTRRGERVHDAIYLQDGFAGRYRLDWSGRRQFLSLQIPGDFIDLPSLMVGYLDHDIATISPAICVPFPHQGLHDLRETRPQLYDQFWRVSLRDAAIHRYAAFRVGRLAGRARIANFFAEVFARQFARRLCDKDGFALPLTQADIGEACGMTPVHANRMLSELRSEGLCTLEGGVVTIHDLPGLARAGQFEWDYLYLPDPIDAELTRLIGQAGAKARRRGPRARTSAAACR